MQPKKHLLATCSVLLMAALLAACAAPAAEPMATPVPPTATPIPPTATPVPPTATPGPLDVALAYESAWNTFDAAAVTALFAEPFNTDYGFPMTDKTAWSEGWPYGMARGMGMRIAMHDCEVSGDTVTCKVASQSPCFTMDVIEALTVQDGKITKLEHRGIPAEDARWEEYSTAVEKWAEEQGLDEWPAYQAEVAKGTYGYDWGAGFVSLCQKYEAAGQAQANDPFAVVQAWVDAIYSGDVDEALSYFTDDGKYLVYYTAYDKESMRWVFNWLAGLETKHENFDCQPQDDKLACTYMVLDGCIAAFDSKGLPVKATFTFQDRKIKDATGGTVAGPEWDGYWDFVTIVQSWERVFRPEEYAQYTQNEGTTEAAKVAIKLCREYEEIVKTQEPATAAAAQGLVAALNSGDADAALALFTQSGETKFRMMSAEVVGADQLGTMFDWLAGKGTQFQIADCEWQGIGTQCAATVIDDCIAASGAAEGLHGKMTFYSQEDGTLRHVIVVPTTVERKAYETWLEAETAWASANRADELAQAEGYSREAGTMAVKLCREYAETLK